MKGPFAQIKTIIRLNRLNVSVLAYTLALFSIPSTTLSQGNLLLLPKRIVFEGSKRSEQISLANIGKDTATYFISFIQIRMKPDGSFEQITEPDPGQQFASKNLRFFPRSVTLAPNESQVVRIQLSNSTALEPGEYRSHLYFRAIPVNKPLGEANAAKDTAISIKLVPIFGISIPVIIRKGENTTGLELSGIHLQLKNDTLPVASVTINRTGNMSAYGDLSLDYTSPLGEVTRVGIIKGMAVYAPNTERQVNILLKRDSLVDYHSGKLHIVFSDKASLKIAQEEISLR